MELEESVIESTFAFSRFASLMLVLAIVFIVISLIQYKIKKKRTKVLSVISGILVLVAIVFFILGHFLVLNQKKLT